LVEEGLGLVRSAGPVAFLVAMIVLPAFGVPMLAFTLPVVSTFGPRWGTGPVVLVALLAMTANYVLAYALARRGLRPLLSRLIARLGYRMPEVAAGDANDLVVILRLTPGLPFFAQNYLAGLAEVPFRPYLWISAVITWPMAAGFMLFGDALLHGKGKVALIALSLLVVLTAITHVVRRHYRRKSAP
jgi:uncharacterized membrane protein YdjX (TVP38/TMEM64 family)